MSDDSIHISVSMYECPKHGKTNEIIQSTIQGHRGSWCMLCVLEKLDELGVNRVTRVVSLKDENENE